MKTGELLIEIVGWSFLIGWVVLLLIFVIKKPGLSNLRIGIYFTLVYKIIGQLILLGIGYVYYYGFLNINEILLNFFLNIDWLLIPIIVLVSSIIRRIQSRREKSIN